MAKDFGTYLATRICCEICAIPAHNTMQLAPKVATVTLGPNGEKYQGDSRYIMCSAYY